MPIQELSGIEQIMKLCPFYFWRHHREKEIRPRRGGSAPHSESSLSLQSAKNKVMHRKVLGVLGAGMPHGPKIVQSSAGTFLVPMCKEGSRNFSIQNVIKNIFLLSTRTRYVKSSCFLFLPPPNIHQLPFFTFIFLLESLTLNSVLHF